MASQAGLLDVVDNNNSNNNNSSSSSISSSSSNSGSNNNKNNNGHGGGSSGSSSLRMTRTTKPKNENSYGVDDDNSSSSGYSNSNSYSYSNYSSSHNRSQQRSHRADQENDYGSGGGDRMAVEVGGVVSGLSQMMAQVRYRTVVAIDSVDQLGNRYRGLLSVIKCLLLIGLFIQGFKQTPSFEVQQQLQQQLLQQLQQQLQQQPQPQQQQQQLLELLKQHQQRQQDQQDQQQQQLQSTPPTPPAVQCNIEQGEVVDVNNNRCLFPFRVRMGGLFLETLKSVDQSPRCEAVMEFIKSNITNRFPPSTSLGTTNFYFAGFDMAPLPPLDNSTYLHILVRDVGLNRQTDSPEYIPANIVDLIHKKGFTTVCVDGSDNPPANLVVSSACPQWVYARVGVSPSAVTVTWPGLTAQLERLSKSIVEAAQMKFSGLPPPAI